jgi:NADPH:quinone reductase-like Zn-dependent oxidoreductase
MARVVRFHQHGGPEVLRIEDLAVPQPGPDEVRVQVKALGLNRAEVLLRQGRYIETPELPSGLGLEAAGIVESLGEGVQDFSLGDSVSLIPPVSMVRWPAYAELAVFPAALLARHPPALGWELAAASWMQYLTAYGALVEVAGLAAGEPVAITAASSSVGLAAIQVARAVGAVPIAVTRRAAKRPALLEQGAAHVVVTDEEDLQQGLMQASGGRGVRVVLDPVGGPIFEALTAAMSPGGILLEYGGLSPDPTPFPLFQVLSKRLTLRGYLVHEITTDPARLARARSFVLEGLQSGRLRPVIARTFSFGQIADAHRFLESNDQVGKIVVLL